MPITRSEKNIIAFNDIDSARLRCMRCSEMGTLMESDGQFLVTCNGTTEKITGRRKAFTCCQTMRRLTIQDAVRDWESLHDEEEL